MIYVPEPEYVKNHLILAKSGSYEEKNISPTSSGGSTEDGDGGENYNPEESFTTTIFPEIQQTEFLGGDKDEKYIGKTDCKQCSLGCEAIENNQITFEFW